MLLQEILFWIFSIALAASAVLVIVSPNPVASAMFLIALFFFMSGLYTLLGAFFLAVIQILIYAGAVMVLFLFVIMLLDPKEPRRWWFKNAGLIGAPLLGLIFLLELSVILTGAPWKGPAADTKFTGSLVQIVTPLFTKYLLPLEITGLILLVSIIGVVMLARKEDAK